MGIPPAPCGMPGGRAVRIGRSRRWTGLPVVAACIATWPWIRWAVRMPVTIADIYGMPIACSAPICRRSYEVSKAAKMNRQPPALRSACGSRAVRCAALGRLPCRTAADSVAALDSLPRTRAVVDVGNSTADGRGRHRWSILILSDKRRLSFPAFWCRRSQRETQ